MIVAGIGNPYRGDDGAGWAVIQELEKTADPKFLRKCRADAGELMEIFKSCPAVTIVDACLADAPSGSWRRIDAIEEAIPPERSQTSTHGFSLIQIIDLAKTIRQLPDQLIIYAIAGKEFRMQNRLSAAVSQAVMEVAQTIDREIQICMKNTSSTI